MMRGRWWIGLGVAAGLLVTTTLAAAVGGTTVAQLPTIGPAGTPANQTPPRTPLQPILITATPQGVPPPLPTNTVYPLPQPTCAAPLSFSIGQSVVLTGGVNLRHQPTLSGAIVNYYESEVVLTVLDGPACESGYNWWRVGGIGEPGWVVEGRPGRYFLSPAAGSATACFPALNLPLNTEITFISGSRVRAEADANALVITVADAGGRATVLDGPVCVVSGEDGTNAVNYWRVRLPFNNPGDPLVEGWVAEGYPDEYWIASLVPAASAPSYCRRPLRLGVGTRAAVTYTDGVPRTLRDRPTIAGAAVQPLIAGIAFDITGAAVCADGYNWWPVRLVGTTITGWLAEGLPGNYWFDIITEVSPGG